MDALESFAERGHEGRKPYVTARGDTVESPEQVLEPETSGRGMFGPPRNVHPRERLPHMIGVLRRHRRLAAHRAIDPRK